MTVLTATELVRFWSHVVKGPGQRDCWIWVGAIADDAYGRFWTQRAGRERVLRPHRVAYALATGADLSGVPVVEHMVCDNPICVRAAGDQRDHLSGGTQADNLRRMVTRGRAGMGGRRMGRQGRAERAARSRTLRAAVIDGWDAERIEAALTTSSGNLALW
ncbi:hypothetical protein [Aeromicrobium sp. CTD01-1L150]|uniref:hypothetical protein n=1 Tax=Aeromicrobium sp. CTD01-1L150 TaxID=3341830 RepID=UPI0035C14EB3